MRPTRDAHARRGETGFSLLEVTVALGILTGALLLLADLFIVAGSAARSARALGLAGQLAALKMEQLRGLAWGYDSQGLEYHDTTSDLTVWPERRSGGRGLATSPAGSLNEDTPGHVDYLDAAGQWLGAGTTAPPGTRFVRRWSVEPVPECPRDALVLRVVVLARSSGAATTAARAPVVPLARLITIRSRRAE